MNMKRTLLITVVSILALALLTACGAKGEDRDSGLEGNSGDSAPPIVESSDSGSPPGTAPVADTESNQREPAWHDARVIKPAELIALEDAQLIVGKDLILKEENFERVETYGGLRNLYTAYDCIFQIALKQNALLDENMPQDKAVLDRGGIASYIKDLRHTYENDESVIPITGVGDYAGISNPVGSIHILIIDHGDYLIEFSLNGSDKAWVIEKLTEAANLAAERLEAII